MALFNIEIVARSTEESRAASEISALAVLETIFCTIGMWWLVGYTGWTFLLLSSVVLAFLMLLRSPQSVSLGVKRLDQYWEAEKVSKKNKVIVWVVIIVLPFAFIWLENKYWFFGYAGFSLFWRALIVGLIILNIDFAGALVGAVALAAAGVVWKAFVVALVGTVVLAVTGWEAVKAVVGLVGAGALVVVVALAGRSFGIYLRILYIRSLSVFQFFGQGLRHFSANWRALTIVTDSFSAPDLLPGLPKNHQLNTSSLWQKATNEPDAIDIVYSFLSLPIFFAPALIYRFYLKSTAWIYLPLLWLAYVPPVERSANGVLTWDKAKGRSALDKIFAWLAAAGLVVLIYSLTNLAGFLAASQKTTAATGVFSPWLILRSMDLSTLLG